MIRSLRMKLILAFMLTAIVGTLFVAVVVSVRTQAEFNDFLEAFEVELGESEDDEESEGEHLLSPQEDFLERIGGMIIVSASLAAGIAVVLGLLLARSLSKPVLALTDATEAIAAGDFGHQIPVKSKDEIGLLAASFNQMSSELARATQLRKQMTADIAHDLRTPLSILSGYTEGLKEGDVKPTEELYSILHEEVQHLTHLVEDLRLLSLADSGELSLTMRDIDPKAVLEKAALAYILQAEKKGITIRVVAGDELPSIRVDVARMTQVFNNLVANALRYTDAGEIVLSAFVDNARVVLSVRDTGAGIAQDALPHIFDRFYRADQSRQRVEDGTSGLGLAIAKSIVVLMGGTILVESDLGVGSVFSVQFPVV